jgi:hypothetical protein
MEEHMELNISELRQKRKPLWMTNFGIESFADMLGGGGDLRFDRLDVDWGRSGGIEPEGDFISEEKTPIGMAEDLRISVL